MDKEEVWWGSGRPWACQGQPRETCPAEVILRQRLLLAEGCWQARARPQPFLSPNQPQNPRSLPLAGGRSSRCELCKFPLLYVNSLVSGAERVETASSSWREGTHVWRDCEDCGRFVITHAATTTTLRAGCPHLHEEERQRQWQQACSAAKNQVTALLLLLLAPRIRC